MPSNIQICGAILGQAEGIFIRWEFPGCEQHGAAEKLQNCVISSDI